MNLDEYAEETRKFIELSEGFRKGKVSRNRFDYVGKIKLQLKDNYQVLLSSDYRQTRDLLTGSVDFERVTTDEKTVSGEILSRFNYKPGTVFIDAIEWERENKRGFPRLGEIGTETQTLIKKIKAEYRTRLSFHTEQGDGPKSIPELFNPGVIMDAPSEVAVGMSLLRVLELAKERGLKICLPFGFFLFAEERTKRKVIFS